MSLRTIVDGVLTGAVLGLLVIMYPKVMEPDYHALQEQALRMKVDGNYLCSAVAISDDRVLTAGHCTTRVTDDSRVTVTTYDGKEYEVTVARVDFTRRGDSDIAMLHVRDYEDHPALDRPSAGIPKRYQAEVSCTSPGLGGIVYAVGSPGAAAGGATWPWTVTKGRVSTEHARPGMDREDWLSVDVTLDKGNSGGPVFNKDGELVGIVSHGNRVSDYNAAVGPGTICDFINR